MTEMTESMGDEMISDVMTLEDIRELHELNPDEAARLQRKYEQEMAEKRADMFEDDYRMGEGSNV